MAYNRNGSGKDVDLDLFLTAIESKLRGPFSSLDLTKTVTTPALRGNDVSESQYLKRISQVLSKSDKISQMRILIGLLGLDPEPELDQVVFSILKDAQSSEEQDLEWVRVIAGLIEGIMFKEDDESGTQCYGEIAKSLLDKTCDEIIEKVDNLAETTLHHAEMNGSSGETLSLMTADFDPVMAPYRYSLLNPNLLKEVIPDAFGPNPHFTVNDDAPILALDATLEIERAREEEEHAMQKQSLQRAGSGVSNRSSGSTAAAAPIAYMPGMNRKRPTNEDATGGGGPAKKKPAVERPKTSMFLTAKKPPGVAAAAAAAGTNAKRTALHVRKTGAAQRLVGKGRQLQPTATTTTTTGGGGGVAAARTATTVGAGATTVPRFGGGRALKALAAGAGARSKMKMIDDAEASDLAKQQQQQPDQPPTKLGGGVKRKALLNNKPTVVAKTSRAALLEKKAPATTATQANSPTIATSPAANTAPESPPEPSLPPESASEEENDEEPEKMRNDNHSSLDTAALARAAITKYQSATSPPPKQQRQDQQPPPSASRNSAKNNNQRDFSNAANALAAAALSEYQTRMAAAAASSADTDGGSATEGGGGGGGNYPTTAPRQLNWQKLLSTKSNRLTEPDRQRVQLFFEDRRNPTPQQHEKLYKMKLHEERTTDASGKPVKETYYLELNYENFTSKQSKKVKRYD